MKKFINILIATTMFSSPAFAKGRIQNEDIKSLSELTAAGGQMSSLINDSKIYVTSNGINSQLSTAITNGLLGGAGGTKNYLANGVVTANSAGTPNTGNGDFEKGTTAGFSLARTALSSLYPTSVATAGTAFSSAAGGSAVAGTLSLGVASTLVNGLISKNYSGSLVSTGASTAGDSLITSAFAIDSDQSKILNFSISYRIVSGSANLNQSASSANSFAVYAYDVTNGAWIQPANPYVMNGSGTIAGSFQVPSNTTKLQIALVNVNASAGAYTMTVDDFTVGPNAAAPNDGRAIVAKVYTQAARAINTTIPTIVYEQVISDTVSGYNTANGLYTVQVAGYYKVSGYVRTVATNFSAGNVIVGYVKINGTATNLYKFGGQRFVANISGGYADFSGSTTTAYLPVGSTISSGIYSDVSTTVDSNSTNTFEIERVSGPTSGDEGRTVAAKASVGTSSIGGGTLDSPVAISAGSVLNDTHAGLSGSVYTVQVTGFYSIQAGLNFSSVASAATYRADILVNGGVAAANQYVAPNANQFFLPVSTIAYATQGQVIRLAAEGSGGAFTVGGDSRFNYISINRISGPTANSATESVYATARATSNGSYPASGTFSTLAYQAIDKDTHAALAPSGVYTVVVAGEYEVCSNVTSANASAAILTDMSLNIGGYSMNGRQYGLANQANTQSMCYHAPAKVGDAISVAVRCTYGSGVCALSTALGGPSATTTIKKIGN